MMAERVVPVAGGRRALGSSAPAQSQQQQRRRAPPRPRTQPIPGPKTLPPNAAPLPPSMPVRRPPPRVGPLSTALRRFSAVILAYPIERIRLGLQTHVFLDPEDDRLIDWTGGFYSAAASIIEADGLLGLWSGLPVSLVHRVAAETIGVLIAPYMTWNLFSEKIMRNYYAWLLNELVKYSISHVLRYLILNPLDIAKVQITADLGIEKNQRREKWRKEQEAKKGAEKNSPTLAEGEEADASEGPKEEPVDPEEVKTLNAWWPLPFGAVAIIQRVWKEDGVRGLLTGYPSTLLGAVTTRGLSITFDIFGQQMLLRMDTLGPIPMILTRMFGSSVIGILTFPLITGAHICMAQVGCVPKAQRIGGGSELWCAMQAYHTPETWVQAVFSVAAGVVNFGVGVAFDLVTRRGQPKVVRPLHHKQQQSQSRRR